VTVTEIRFALLDTRLSYLSLRVTGNSAATPAVPDAGAFTRHLEAKGTPAATVKADEVAEALLRGRLEDSGHAVCAGGVEGASGGLDVDGAGDGRGAAAGDAAGGGASLAELDHDSLGEFGDDVVAVGIGRLDVRDVADASRRRGGHRREGRLGTIDRAREDGDKQVLRVLARLAVHRADEAVIATLLVVEGVDVVLRGVVPVGDDRGDHISTGHGRRAVLLAQLEGVGGGGGDGRADSVAELVVEREVDRASRAHHGAVETSAREHRGGTIRDVGVHDNVRQGRLGNLDVVELEFEGCRRSGNNGGHREGDDTIASGSGGGGDVAAAAETCRDDRTSLGIEVAEAISDSHSCCARDACSERAGECRVGRGQRRGHRGLNSDGVGGGVNSIDQEREGISTGLFLPDLDSPGTIVVVGQLDLASGACDTTDSPSGRDGVLASICFNGVSDEVLCRGTVVLQLQLVSNTGDGGVGGNHGEGATRHG